MPADRPRRGAVLDPCLTGPGSRPYHTAAVVLEALTADGLRRLLT
jgi:hypothetical protein